MVAIIRWARQHKRSIFVAITLTLILTAFIIHRHDTSRDHYLTADIAHHAPLAATAGQVLLSPGEAKSMCRANDFPTYKKQNRKVYEILLINTELDWLEVGLHELGPYVDYFVVVEADTTFTGIAKPLHFKEDSHLFKDFQHKIIHRAVHDPIVSSRIWDHEDWFRESSLHEVFPSLEGTEAEANDGDALLVSDMDEIVRPGVLLLRYCDFPSRLILRTDFFYYSYQWRHRGPQWSHPDATVYRGRNTLDPNALRQGLLGPGWTPIAALRRWWDRATIWNAGWHCSSCFATVAEMRFKMNSFSHQPWNTPYCRELPVLTDRVRHGKDLFGREGENYDRAEGNRDVPAYALEQHEKEGRFKYMMTRDGEDAGFEDWKDAPHSDPKRG
ncbi:hypothetical protein CLAFUW4_03766 [Fulvia fulva]|uniref:Glycosyltransferase family 17 protein n=1 Tax=Passalora fulva TaxID=5499 RepID=A0A9Q8LBF7_PASFU|nr:uncharacterized protein CLAFUR5_03738 [Fulvia fulva]UJO14314.1 hypothetical protein CLAFUR5_03738 [Fulvia fulva]WPV11094.1 hypothetical protein CLAFUW4_03766 [Fulvia fulva]